MLQNHRLGVGFPVIKTSFALILPDSAMNRFCQTGWQNGRLLSTTLQAAVLSKVLVRTFKGQVDF
jgi:hypothetical protein